MRVSYLLLMSLVSAFSWIQTLLLWYLFIPCEELPTVFKINGLKNHLRQIIEPDDDFLSRLIDKDVLTFEQYESVCSKTTVCDKNEQLLSYLLDRNCTVDHDEVLKALEESDQQHVANYIFSAGSRYHITCYHVQINADDECTEFFFIRLYVVIIETCYVCVTHVSRPSKWSRFKILKGLGSEDRFWYHWNDDHANPLFYMRYVNSCSFYRNVRILHPSIGEGESWPNNHWLKYIGARLPGPRNFDLTAPGPTVIT